MSVFLVMNNMFNSYVQSRPEKPSTSDLYNANYRKVMNLKYNEHIHYCTGCGSERVCSKKHCGLKASNTCEVCR